MGNKLWQKSFSTDTSIEQFTVGRDAEMDLLLAPFDVLGSIAHVKMLEKIELLSEEETKALTKELQNIYREIEKGNFEIEEGVEDVHSQVELMLTRSLGDTGKKIHSGRSRNDQVLVDLKLYIRNEIRQITEATEGLFRQLQELSNTYKDYLMPGYTHLQTAMPSSFGLWFGAYAESLADDMRLMLGAYETCNKNPLGSGAGYGSSFPLDRRYTTELLGFDDLDYNVVYAQMTRGKTERNVSWAMSSIAATLGKFAMDVCLYMSPNFGFITFPDELTTGSSIMPHKKNPDVFELIRGKCNTLQALPTETGMLQTNLPSGYHREMQLLKENFFPAFDTLKDCLNIATYMLKHIQVKEDLLKDPSYKYVFSVEKVNKLVLEGVPFRDAYKQVGEMIEAGTFEPEIDVNHTHEGSIGNLCNDRIRERMEATLRQFRFEKLDEVEKALLGR